MINLYLRQGSSVKPIAIYIIHGYNEKVVNSGEKWSKGERNGCFLKGGGEDVNGRI